MSTRLRFQHFLLVFLCLEVVILTSCKDDDVEEVPGLNGSWILSHIEETSADGTTSSLAVKCADIVFTNEVELPSSGQLFGIKMNGWLPVNSYTGHYQASHASIAIQQGEMNFVNLSTTEKKGLASDMEFENYYIGALQNVKRFEVKNDQLTLWNAEENVKLVYVRGSSSCGR